MTRKEILEKTIDFDDAINRIVRLEKENAELRAKESFVGDQNRKLCDQQQKIEVLEAENAELKEKLKPENCIEYLARGGYVKFLCENGNEHDQLTKAKELLKNILSAYTSYADSFDDRDNEIVAEAEQFIKDSEVEK